MAKRCQSQRWHNVVDKRTSFRQQSIHNEPHSGDEQSGHTHRRNNQLQLWDSSRQGHHYSSHLLHTVINLFRLISCQKSVNKFYVITWNSAMKSGTYNVRVIVNGNLVPTYQHVNVLQSVVTVIFKRVFNIIIYFI